MSEYPQTTRALSTWILNGSTVQNSIQEINVHLISNIHLCPKREKQSWYINIKLFS